MSDGDEPDRHLQRAGAGDLPGIRPLGLPTGMHRLQLEERQLLAGERVRIAGPPAAEGFVYVLSGRGVLEEGGGQVSSDGAPTLATGDFIALARGEAVHIRNPETSPLRLLVGFGGGGAGAAAQQQQ